MMDIKFIKAMSRDIKTLIDINNKSYKSDYIRYGQCPGYNVTKDQMSKALCDRNTQKYLIYKSKTAIGEISVKKIDDGVYYLGNLCVIPEYQRKGIGKSAIEFIMNEYKDFKKITLITPLDKIQNINFYKKCGFKITGEEFNGKVKMARFTKMKEL